MLFRFTAHESYREDVCLPLEPKMRLIGSLFAKDPNDV